MADEKDESVRRAIDRLKLDDIVARAREHYRWTAVQGRYAAKWYRNYLWLSYKHGGKPVYAIVEEADELWHAHLVYTKRYRADCQRIFGRFLEHNPYRGPVTKRMRALFEQAEEWYEQEYPGDFGDPETHRRKGDTPNLVHWCY